MNLALSSSKILFSLTAVSFITLISVWILERFYSLAPCELCVYQRIPYLLIFFISGIATVGSRNQTARRLTCAISSILFLATASIGVYHLGAENNWWVTGCSASSGQIFSLDSIQSAISGEYQPACNEIQMRVFGISLAGYNVILGLTLASIFTFLSMRTVYWPQLNEKNHE